eukprot:6192490-Pleurochrysis_carterae.AAC.6
MNVSASVLLRGRWRIVSCRAGMLCAQRDVATARRRTAWQLAAASSRKRRAVACGSPAPHPFSSLQLFPPQQQLSLSSPR